MNVVVLTLTQPTVLLGQHRQCHLLVQLYVCCLSFYYSIDQMNQMNQSKTLIHTLIQQRIK